MSAFRFPQLPNGLSTEQKTAAVLLLFLGLGGIIVGFLSFGAALRRPFDVQLANAPKGFLLDSQKQSAEIEAMKTRDTDGDGLTDYDEVYVYKTSPYLKDTDSDGIDDKTEILAGTDPNCPEGKTCVAESPMSATAVAPTALPSLVPPTPTGGVSPDVASNSTLAQAAVNGKFASQADVVAYLKSLGAPQARQLLLQAGLTKDKLDPLTDAQVLQLFGQIVDKAAAAGQLAPAVAGPSPKTP